MVELISIKIKRGESKLSFAEINTTREFATEDTWRIRFFAGKLVIIIFISVVPKAFQYFHPTRAIRTHILFDKVPCLLQCCFPCDRAFA